MLNLSLKALATYSTSALLMFCLSSPAAAACKRPEAPEIPDAELADDTEIGDAIKEVKAYVSDMQGYISCERRDSRVRIAEKQLRQVVKQHNHMIRQYREILAEYNENKGEKAPMVTALVEH